MSKTALITGASKRIGKRIVYHLAERGWNLILHYNRSREESQKIVNDLGNTFPSANFYSIAGNLADNKAISGLIPSIISRWGPFDLLVNNASFFDPGYLKETSRELFENQLDVNLKAPFFLIRDFATYCKSGNIINFVDTRISSNKSNFAAYSLSKKALWDLTKMAALELAPDIRVNAIAPGVTLAPSNEDDAYLHKLAKDIPMKTPVGLDPILKSIDYILDNKHLTGQLLYADGGENLGKNI